MVGVGGGNPRAVEASRAGRRDADDEARRPPRLCEQNVSGRRTVESTVTPGDSAHMEKPSTSRKIWRCALKEKDRRQVAAVTAPLRVTACAANAMYRKYAGGVREAAKKRRLRERRIAVGGVMSRRERRAVRRYTHVG